MSLTFDPYIPLALWLPLALAAAGLLVAYAVASRRRIAEARRWSVLALMSVAAALPLVVLLNPTWVETLPPPAGKPLLTVLVDESASMATGDQNGKPRLVEAARLTREAVRALADRYEVRLRSFAETSSPLSLGELDRQTADGAGTDLAAAIADSLEDRPQGQALLLLSDGGHNAGSIARLRESLDQAKALAAPIFTRTLGTSGGVNDVEVRVNLPQELAFVRQETPVTVSLRQRGQVTDRAKIALVLDGQQIAEQEVLLSADGTAQAVFPVSRDQSGLYRFELRVDPLPGEATPLNNSATLVLRVVDEPVRVLLLEGKPYWDAKFLVRTLGADESVQLETIVRLAEGRYLRRTISHAPPEAPPGNAEAAAPMPLAGKRSEQWTIETDASRILADPERLAAYQVVVLGRDAEEFLSDQAVSRLGKWLAEENGALVCFRGPPASQLSRRLGDLVPVRWSPGREERFRVQLTEMGQSMPWLAGGGAGEAIESLPSLATTAQPEQPKPLAVVLATSQGAQGKRDPVITYQPVGGGRVVVVEGAGMWRWAFLPPEHQEHDQVYRVLWRSLVRWLVSQVELLPSQQLALRSDKVTFDPRETATATLLVRDAQAGRTLAVELRGATGEPAQPQLFTPVPDGEAPGQFRVVFGQLPEGRYEASVVGAAEGGDAGRAVFDVRIVATERLDVAARPDVMKLVAETSGGAVLDGDDPAELSRRIDEHLGAALPKRTLRTTAWDRWWVLVGVLAAWAATWALRRGSGLV
jgi:hypothetical protein